MAKSVKDYEVRMEFFQKCALAVILCGVVLSLPTLCLGHGDEINPSFKYSREANENFDSKKAPPPAVHHHDHHDHIHEHHEHPHDHHEHTHDHHHHDDSPHKPASDMSQIWLHSIGSTLLISAAPFVLLYIIPLDNSESMKPRLKVLLAFASGGLLGDAFLHLIPHATHPHSHADHGHAHDHHHHDHDDHHGHDHHDDHQGHSHDMSVGLWVLGGIIAFLSVEKIVRILKGGHGHSHGAPKPKAVEKTNKKSSKKSESEDEKKTNKAKANKDAKKSIVPAEEEGEVEIAGYLNLAADFAHNFTDGLAIGASYLAGNSIGIITTITILLHEVPHEIGDFAILIKSGCSRRKAMLLQLVTALGAVAGTAIALLGAGSGSNADGSAPWVLPFTAGGFIYIATVSVLPELLEESTKLKQSLKEILALLTGVGLMIVIAKFE